MVQALDRGESFVPVLKVKVPNQGYSNGAGFRQHLWAQSSQTGSSLP